MTAPRDAIGLKQLGQRTDGELETMFGDMYAGWDRGVNVTQERLENGDTRFTETPMTPLELAARYVAAEIGANIYEVANRAAFAPITVFSQIQARIGPVFEEAATALDALQARVKELEAECDRWADASIKSDQVRLDLRDRATRAEQERDQWRTQAKYETDVAQAAADEVARLKQERDEALERLKPFAAAAESLDESHLDRMDLWESPSGLEITAGHLRAARDLVRRLAAGTEKEGK